MFAKCTTDELKACYVSKKDFTVFFLDKFYFRLNLVDLIIKKSLEEFRKNFSDFKLIIASNL